MSAEAFGAVRFSLGGRLRDMLQPRPRLLLVAYALVLGVEAGGNIWINCVGFSGRS